MTRTTEELVARRVQLDEQITRLQGEKDQINIELAKLAYGNHSAGDWTVNIQHNRRLDTARIEQRFPVAQYPHLYEPKVSTAAVQESYAPVELEQFYIEGRPKVLVK